MVNTKVRLISPLSILLQALGFMALGITTIAASGLVMRFVRNVLIVSLSVNAALSLTSFIFVSRKRRAPVLITALSSGVAAAVFAARPALLGAGFGFVVGLWSIFNAIVQLMFAAQLYVTRSGGIAKHAAEGVVLLFFGAALVSSPLMRLDTVNLVAGIYFVLWGISLFTDFLSELLHWDVSGQRIKRHIRVAMPVLLVAFIPSRWVDSLNKLLNAEQTDLLELKKPNWESEPVPLEVFFHLGKHVAMGFGHVDFCLEGTFYSYGCYDSDSSWLFDVFSDGVLAQAPRDRYIHYATRFEHKTLVAYGFALDDKQTRQVREAVERIKGMCTPWTPPDTIKRGHEVGGALDMRQRAGLSYMKLSKGPYQKYNAIRTNCVALAEMLVSESGLPLLQQNGIITPGSYLSYVERMFELSNTFVVTKTIYRDAEAEGFEKAAQATAG